MDIEKLQDRISLLEKNGEFKEEGKENNMTNSRGITTKDISKNVSKPEGAPPSVCSTSDDRIKNDVMHIHDKILSSEDKARIATIKDLGQEFHEYLAFLGRHSGELSSRGLNIASTKIEEAVMWAVKEITK